MAEPTKPSLDAVTTIRDDGSRRFIHPASVSGRFTRARTLVGALLMLVYIALPWIPINGHPAVFLDVINRQFHILGLTFVTQDLWLGFFVITGVGFSLFYITALLGRIWCGWACPQTVFLDIVRRIERWIEGDATARRKLDDSPWTGNKTLRRGGSRLALGLFAFVVAHVFLSYFVSIPHLYKMMTNNPGENWGAFVFVFAMTFALWFDFAWFREQFCIILCPYGRIQSALTDDNTLNIGYDELRGEPRGKKGATTGDCIDCRKCVQVCPTGIDIRHGLQLECIGCAACVDACDSVMEKLERAPGLIRYDSFNGLKRKPRKIIRPRIIFYTVLLAIGVVALSLALSRLQSLTVSMNRLSAAAYFLDGPDEMTIRNQFLVRIMNKRNATMDCKIEVLNPPAGLDVAGIEKTYSIPAESAESVALIMRLPRANFKKDVPLKVRISTVDGKSSMERTMTFLGPKI
ncbi:MAG: cytochrome c oxidase accessory protein CcoG [Verrucomicrobiota bacterium]|jgi:cytochrome c oxidase accessory protein FixG